MGKKKSLKLLFPIIYSVFLWLFAVKMLVEEPTEIVIIRIVGLFLREDILKIVNTNDK